MKYILIILSTLLLACSTSKIDYREAYITKPHVIDVTLPNFIATNTSYTYTIYTHPYVKEIQFRWYYGKIDATRLMMESTLHPLNNERVDNPYKLKWGIETDFIAQYPGEYILVVHTVDMYGNDKLYNRRYRVTQL